MKKIMPFLVMIMFFSIGTIGMITTQSVINPTLVYADGPDLNTIQDGINNAKNELGDATTNKVKGIAKGAQEVVLVVVIAALMISGSITAVKFANVGDNSSEKAKLKTTLMYIIGGIIFLASFYSLMKFGFTNLNVFGS
ncbi:hypothetical protein FDB50_16940 [Clostridium botulinum]|uniref:Uncharacterized protein n=1 Tax=Clostridium botulinum TaxID=1491 RepID=A0A846K0W6_CLOBO|nr:hypothetical protein [Clostridium botulinum]NFN06379.1 hypothetical protein [Clostridium botulinum]NFN19763.1 hypothetical protein [Clostridium botulinum]NFN36751.1 hypothetical protein [Clostridium botulinum]